jgi:transposase
MSHSFSIDLRERVLRSVLEGVSTRQAAARYGVGISTAGHWFRRYRDHGELAARKQGQPKGSKLDAYEAFILGLVDKTPDITLDEIAERLASEFGVSACRATVWHFFDKRGITFKKRPPMRASSNAPM